MKLLIALLSIFSSCSAFAVCNGPAVYDSVRMVACSAEDSHLNTFGASASFAALNIMGDAAEKLYSLLDKNTETKRPNGELARLGKNYSCAHYSFGYMCSFNIDTKTGTTGH